MTEAVNRHQVERLRDGQVLFQRQRVGRHVVGDRLLRQIVDQASHPVQNIPFGEDADQPVFLVRHKHAADVVLVHLPDRARQRAALTHGDRHLGIQLGQRIGDQKILKVGQDLFRLVHLVDVLFIQSRDRHFIAIGGQGGDLSLLRFLPLLHRPQVRGQVELIQVAGPALLLRRPHLPDQLARVVRLADIADHAHRRGVVGKLHAAQNRRQRL